QIDINGTLSENNLRLLPSQTSHFSPLGVTGLTSLGATDRSGFTAGGSIDALGSFGGGARYGRRMSNAFSLVPAMNGDGFPDLAYQSGSTVYAYINDGNRNFNQQQWAGYSLANAPFSTADRVTQANTAQAFFKTDPLLRWVAPFGGTVTVNAAAVKLGNT